MKIQHQELSEGKWSKLSLAEQLGNIGSEVDRALKWKNKDQAKFQKAFERALELLDLTVQDSRWKNRLSEIVRAREVLCDALTGGKNYQSCPEDLNKYFLSFALLARRQKYLG